MISNETAPRGRTAAGWSAMAGGLIMAGLGVWQAVLPYDTTFLVLGLEHLSLGLFAVSLILLVPGLIALARHGGRAALAGAATISVGHVLLAFGATSSNLHGEDYPWFVFVAIPANLAMLAGGIVMAVSLWRTGHVPRLVAAILPLLWFFEIILSQLGGSLVAGVYWLVVGRMFVAGTADRRLAATG
ncbi:hypothetical protein [Planotetraspora mira]|nr:hypothetical protein [Planotetraspora mira]